MNGWVGGRLAGSQGGFNRLGCLAVNMMNVNCRNLIGQFVTALRRVQRWSLCLCGIQRRGRRRGEQTVDGRTCDPRVVGTEGQADVSIGFHEIVNW